MGGVLQTLADVWEVVQVDLEANLLVFLEKLFLLEPAAVMFQSDSSTDFPF
jgi:hypothetical protein